MAQIEKISFPSVDMPGADLRMSLEYNDTKYSFTCPECGKQISIILEDYLKYEYKWQDIFPANLVEQIKTIFNSSSTYCLSKCDTCNSEYVFHIRYYETSNNAYRAEVLNAGRIIR